jgi:ParB-like chromosome segregation protein Spo0J
MSDNLTHIKDLIPDPKNRRKHTPRNVGMIVDALQKVGAGRSIVIDENNEVLAGNATIEAAGEAGITKLKVIDATGNEIVAVRRTGLTTDQKRDLAIFDNRTGELAEWDAKQILEDASASIDLSSFFSDVELQSILDRAEDLNLDDFFEAAPDDGDSRTVNLVLKFSPDQRRDVLKELGSHGKSPELGILNVLGIT